MADARPNLVKTVCAPVLHVMRDGGYVLVAAGLNKITPMPL